jgi:hypothetical protein
MSDINSGSCTCHCKRIEAIASLCKLRSMCGNPIRNGIQKRCYQTRCDRLVIYP